MFLLVVFLSVFPFGWGQLQQQAFIKASNAQSFNFFGSSVALSANGKTMVVGATGEASSGSGVNANQAQFDLRLNYGAAYIFSRNGTDWLQEAFLKSSTGSDTGGMFGFNVKISGDGNTVVVGTPRGRDNTGYAEIFSRVNGGWKFNVRLNPAGGEFSRSIAISFDGSILVVGCPFWNGGTRQIGKCFIYAHIGTTWSQIQTPQARNSGPTGPPLAFARSVSLDSAGATLAISDTYEGSSGIGVNPANETQGGSLKSGAVYMFSLLNRTWAQVAFIKAPRNVPESRFGSSVCLSADGTSLVTRSLTTVFYYQRNISGAWTYQSEIGLSGDLSLSGDARFLAVGAPSDSSGSILINGTEMQGAAPNSGAAYVFARQGPNWVRKAYIKPSNTARNSNFGISVSFNQDGTALAIGSDLESSTGSGINPKSSGGAVASGAAYFFDDTCPTNSEKILATTPGQMCVTGTAQISSSSAGSGVWNNFAPGSVLDPASSSTLFGPASSQLGNISLIWSGSNGCYATTIIEVVGAPTSSASVESGCFDSQGVNLTARFGGTATGGRWSGHEPGIISPSETSPVYALPLMAYQFTFRPASSQIGTRVVLIWNATGPTSNVCVSSVTLVLEPCATAPLSTGAIAGISVAGLVVLAAAIVGSILLFKRYNASRASLNNAELSYQLLESDSYRF